MRSPINSISVVSATLVVYLGSLLLPYPAQAQTAQNKEAEARRLYEEGVQQFRNSYYKKALETYQQVLAIESERSNNAGVGRILNSIGGVYFDRDQYSQALEVYQGSLAIRRVVNDKAGEAKTLYNIGLVYKELGQDSQAQKSFEQALEIFQEIGDRTGIEAAKEAVSPRQTIESGFSTGTILLDDYDAQATTTPAGSASGEASTPAEIRVE